MFYMECFDHLNGWGVVTWERFAVEIDYYFSVLLESKLKRESRILKVSHSRLCFYLATYYVRLKMLGDV